MNSLQERLALYESKIDRSGDCHEWTGARNPKGYGKFNVDGVNVVASRWGFEQKVGPIPEGMRVLHTCDNPPCQNPAHWFLGTDGDNMRDKMAKGRGTRPPVHRGSAHPGARTNEETVRRIRARSAEGVRQKDLAIEFDLPKHVIQQIVTRRSWKHVVD